MRVGYQPGRAWQSGNPGFNHSRQVKRGDLKDFSRAGHYASPPNGPGPGRGPYPWKQPAPLDAVDFDGGGWVAAPGDSHLAEFRFIYGLDGDFEQAVDGREREYRHIGISVLQVRFRAGGWMVAWSDPGTGYSAARLETIFLMMESAGSPGEIIWSDLIGEGGSVRWPYDSNV